jgi:hypothetical protein
MQQNTTARPIQITSALNFQPIVKVATPQITGQHRPLIMMPSISQSIAASIAANGIFVLNVTQMPATMQVLVVSTAMNTIIKHQ